MENVVLVIHLILALCLIGVVLLQRSEGGALGIGGGGGGLVSARGATTALSKITWFLAIGFITTSITLTILSGGGRDTGSVLDQFIEEGEGAIPLPDLPAPAEDGDALLPPLTPPAAGEGEGAATGATAPQTPPAAQ
ncbi:preprotein translocase subunit SecG [Limibaculum sp. M0105]|uniref:Protein-export membrane protein SecG n=1 Tax=Thermohalobaculum xanthum TaxID=2753746 RepID=A0A8J7M9K4_9RHOB|nr:preprotein translocase subunit SecG [Thermohalobaculum xanthum]MBK0400192.1 preprotein translocase subunit SecG [Thermohalobaculum xanthum]